ncbi:signal recognition particle 19 kDa protein-like [Bidens hawaiensis]|uniref:signal recognition particle 19 kDa protein-like n=1 Tax=Bidens hawaiensis TaxID=980011 RepID=UPI00404A51D4
MMDGGTVNLKTWKILYPVYLNSKKTIAEGRRIPASKACENPTALEIGDCCGHLKIPFAIEIDKAYSRDFMQVGRVRVMLKRSDGSLHNPLISSKKLLMLRVAELVPKHPGRVKKRQAATSASNAAPSKSGRKKRYDLDYNVYLLLL